MKMFNKLAKSAIALTLSSLVAIPVLQAAEPVHAASNAVPSYEVKFMLDANEVLKNDGTLTSDVMDAFEVNSPAKKLIVEYFDTDALDLNDAGWNVRFRKKEDKKDYELTYKKRFSILNGNIDDALNTANAAGFDSSDDNYKAEVDWGYSKQTLSFSVEKKTSASLGLTLPTEAQALNMLVDKIPGKLEKTNGNKWGKNTLKDARAFGPVTVSKYSGMFNGLETDIEVWPIRNAAGTGTENLVEISFKTDSYNTAATNRTALMTYLDASNWLIHADSLKTALVLDRY